jgi:hypothetical protein
MKPADGDIVRRHHSRFAACVAYFAAFALAFQALLSSLTFVPHAMALEFEGPENVICLTSGAAPIQGEIPDAPTSPQHDGCCILCLVSTSHAIIAPTLSAAFAYEAIEFSGWIIPFAERLLGTIEQLPGHPRAPPC